MTAIQPPPERHIGLLDRSSERRPAVSSMLERSVLQAVTYSDIFDYPLTAAEIHRYLIGFPATRGEVLSVLDGGIRSLVPGALSCLDGYYTLPGREGIVGTRKRRQWESTRLWIRAMHYGRIIGSLPFVRMVAITGELAMDNIAPRSDIDYFVVTERGRVWLCRLLAIGVVHYGQPRGDVVCPNYLLADSALELHDRDLYTAHEVAQMVPISGFETYGRFRALNQWIDDYLPNAAGPPRYVDSGSHGRVVRAASEALLRTPVGARLEQWEMERKIRKLSRGAEGHGEVAFSPDWCKGHFDGHGERIMEAFAERWRAVEGVL
jgi:hypothetical protein